MKTKKAILEWWKELGNRSRKNNDLRELLNNLDETVNVTVAKTPLYTGVTLFTHKWKYPLELFFSINEFKQYECYKIVGFGSPYIIKGAK